MKIFPILSHSISLCIDQELHQDYNTQPILIIIHANFFTTVWYIGTSRQADDILPRTEVSFNDSTRAEFDNGIFYLNGRQFANVSEIVHSSQEGSYFLFEPGRLVYNTLELCNIVHRCVAVETSPKVFIRKSSTHFVLL